MKRRLADALVALALRLAPDVRYFDEEDLDAVPGPEQWAGLMILHAEAVHGCDHTDQARASLGMVGPRGKPVVA